MQYFRHDFRSMVPDGKETNFQTSFDVNSWADLMALCVNTQYVHRC